MIRVPLFTGLPFQQDWTHAEPCGQINLPTDRIRVLGQPGQNRGQVVGCAGCFLLWQPDSNPAMDGMGVRPGTEAPLPVRLTEVILDHQEPCLVRLNPSWVRTYISVQGSQYGTRLVGTDEETADRSFPAEAIFPTGHPDYFRLAAIQRFGHPLYGEQEFPALLTKSIHRKDFEIISGRLDILIDLPKLVMSQCLVNP